MGPSLAQILAAADGRMALVALDGTISGVVVELVGLDIAESLSIALSGDDPGLPINCAAADFELVSGTATSKTLIMDTRRQFDCRTRHGRSFD